MQVVESFVKGKFEDQLLCEDMLILGDHFAGVTDGATDKTGAMIGGMTGGRFAAGIVHDAVLQLDPETAINDAVQAITNELRRATRAERPGFDVDKEDGPAATLVLYSRCRHEIWRIGDGGWMASEPNVSTKRIDRIAASARAALINALLADGQTVDRNEPDPGREMILPLLRTQHIFRNNAKAGDLAYAAFDGRTIPETLCEVFTLAPDSRSIVIGTDGYPELRSTLAETESLLAQDLADDPMRIGEHATTKWVAAGQSSFDDRGYVRIDLEAVKGPAS